METLRSFMQIMLIPLTIAFIGILWNKKNEKVSWERNKKLPFYKELERYLDRLDKMLDDKSIFKVLDSEELRRDANNLGLHKVANDLYDILLTLENLEEDRRANAVRPEYVKDRLEMIKRISLSLRGYAWREVEKINK